MRVKLNCKHCGKPLGKFEPRVAIEEICAESWGSQSYEARVQSLDSGLFCGWVCIGGYAVGRQSKGQLAEVTP